jgi:putative oxidoreductase
MYEGHTTLEIVGQLLIAFLFLGTLAINATMKVKQHRDRMVAAGVPAAGPVLWFGFAMQLVGGLSIAFDTRTDIGVPILIVFLVVATAIFHRWWLVDDPIRRHLHFSFVFANTALIGALLLLM